MKLIIAGGRNLRPSVRWVHVLAKIIMRLPLIDEIVSGGAKGADRLGEDFAQLTGITVMRFPADWNRFGKSAGYRRNCTMAEYADAVILLPGGKGTDHMFDIALKGGLWIFDVRCKTEMRIVQHNTPTNMKGVMN